MEIPVHMISFQDCDPILSWKGLSKALQSGHKLRRAEISDTLLYRGDDTLLSRSAWIDGIGIAIKCATIFPGNKNLKKPAINGAVNLFDDKTGQLSALIDFHLVTKWKTAGDSILAAKLLARPNSQNILILGLAPLLIASGKLMRIISPMLTFLFGIGLLSVQKNLQHIFQIQRL